MVRVNFVATTEFRGGAEAHIARLGSRLAQLGPPPVLWGWLADWPRELDHVDLDLSGKWTRKSIARGLFALPEERRALSRLLAPASGPDVYHCHFKREQIGFSGLLAAAGPVVWTEHGLWGRGPYSRAMASAYRAASRSVSAIIAVSEPVADDVAHIVRSGTKVHVIGNSFAAPKTTVQGAVVGVPVPARKRPIRAAFIGRLVDSKRPRLAIKSAVAADCEILVAGDGPLRESLVREFGDSRLVHFLGHVEDMSPVYEAVDVVLFTSKARSEGAPTVILESASQEKPVIGVRDAGFGDWLARCGVCVESNVESIAGAIVSGEWRGTGKQGRDFADQFSEERWVSQHIELYENVM